MLGLGAAGCAGAGAGCGGSTGTAAASGFGAAREPLAFPRVPAECRAEADDGAVVRAVEIGDAGKGASTVACATTGDGAVVGAGGVETT